MNTIRNTEIDLLALLTVGGKALEARQYVSPEDFSETVLGNAFQLAVVVELKQGSVIHEFRSRLPQELWQEVLSASDSAIGSPVYFAKTVKQASKFRKIQKLGERLKSVTEESNLSEVYHEITRTMVDDDVKPTDAKSVMSRYNAEKKRISEHIQSGNEYLGLESGFEFLDKRTNGIQPGHLWIVGGYTSAGKTFFALQVMANLVKQKKRCCFISLEMTEFQIVDRVVSLMAGVQPGQFRRDTDEQNKITKAEATLEESGFSLVEDVGDLQKLESILAIEHMKQKVDCFFIDFLQLIKSAEDTGDYETMKNVAQTLQRVSKRFKTPLIALSQVSNEGAKSPNQTIIPFKGAGDIAAAADLALVLYSKESHEDKQEKLKNKQPISVTFDIKKNRHGATGQETYDFNPYQGGFSKEFSEWES